MNEETPQIPLENIAKKLSDFDEKKEAYRLKYFLYYHLKKKKKAVQGGIIVSTAKDVDLRVDFK